MQTILKEGKEALRTRRSSPSLIKRDDKRRNTAKQTKLKIDYNGLYVVINMQEDEDAAVRTDVWN